MAVVVDAGGVVRAVLSFEAYFGPARPESYFVLEDLDACQARLQPRAAAQDAGRGLGVRFEVPLAILGCPAKDAVTRAGNYVRDALGILFVQHETLYAGVAHAHDLAPDRLHRSVVDQIPGSEPAAVDDHARIYLLKRGEGTPLHASPGSAEAVHQVREIDGHLDHRRDESVAVPVARR